MFGNTIPVSLGVKCTGYEPSYAQVTSPHAVKYQSLRRLVRGTLVSRPVSRKQRIPTIVLLVLADLLILAKARILLIVANLILVEG